MTPTAWNPAGRRKEFGTVHMSNIDATRYLNCTIRSAGGDRHARARRQAKGRERFESFPETLGRRLAKGQSVLREVSLDGLHNGMTHPVQATANAQSSVHVLLAALQFQ